MHNEEYDTIDLMKLFEICKKNLIAFMVIILLLGTCAYVGTALLIDKTYSATATFIIVQKNNTTSNSSVTMNDVNLSQKLVNTYTEILRSEAIGDKVVANLDLFDKYQIDTKALNGIISVSSANNTEVMNVKAVTKDPKLSADIANELVNVFQNEIYDIMQIENITILNNAKVPTEPSGPSKMKNTILGMALGFVACMGYAVYVLLTDTKVKTEEDVKNIFDYPIIGIIPEFEVEEGGKR